MLFGILFLMLHGSMPLLMHICVELEQELFEEGPSFSNVRDGLRILETWTNMLGLISRNPEILSLKTLHSMLNLRPQMSSHIPTMGSKMGIQV